MTMTFDTKIAVVLRDDLPVWQKLNVTAFTISGIAGTGEEVMGENYEDGSGNLYLPMLKQPVLIFGATEAQIQKAYERALQGGVRFTIFTEDLFATSNDIDNRAAVKAKTSMELRIVGLGMRDKKKTIDRVLEGITLHK